MSVQKHLLNSFTNKNTRTLGAGDYPAFEFFLFKSARKSEFLVFLVFHDQKFVARLAREAVP